MSVPDNEISDSKSDPSSPPSIPSIPSTPATPSPARPDTQPQADPSSLTPRSVLESVPVDEMKSKSENKVDYTIDFSSPFNTLTYSLALAIWKITTKIITIMAIT